MIKVLNNNYKNLDKNKKKNIKKVFKIKKN